MVPCRNILHVGDDHIITESGLPMFEWLTSKCGNPKR